MLTLKLCRRKDSATGLQLMYGLWMTISSAWIVPHVSSGIWNGKQTEIKRKKAKEKKQFNW